MIKKFEFTKPRILAWSIPWSILLVSTGKMKQFNNTCRRHWCHLTITYDYVITLAIKNFIIKYHKWLGGPWPTWPTLLSRPCNQNNWTASNTELYTILNTINKELSSFWWFIIVACDVCWNLNIFTQRKSSNITSSIITVTFGWVCK